MKLTWVDTRNFDEYTSKALRRLSGDTEYSEALVNAVKTANDAIAEAYKIYDEEIVKPKLEEDARREKERSLKEDMRFKVSHREADLIDSVLGQMSDGKWENTKSYENYWRNISVEDDDTIVVNTSSLRYWISEKELTKYFMAPDNVKKFFAHKAQLVHNDDLRYGGFKKAADCSTEKAHYLDSYRDKSINQTYGEIQETINMLAGK